jgi:peptide/nickel transport system substrate-binding protein
MSFDLERRTLLRSLALGATGAVSFAGSLTAFAQTAGKPDAVTIGWPTDVPSWDPNQRFTPDAQPIYKLVFDQPLGQAPSLDLVPGLVTKWELAKDGLSLAVQLRDSVRFHNGDAMSADDFRFTFFERLKLSDQIDTKNSWRNVIDVEVLSPTRAVMHFSAPAPTAPQWLAFLGSYVVPKKYIEEAGIEAFRRAPVGTGPYKLVDYELNARIVLERNEDYWGARPPLRRVTVEIIKDPSARMAAVQSGHVDLTINVPVREVARLARAADLAGEINPITRVILLQCRNDRGFADENVRLAAHHAISKEALSKAFYGGAAVPLPVVATPGTPAFVPDFAFAYDPALARTLLAKSGFGPNNPAAITFATTNGHFPSDYDIARAIQQMWKGVGINAELETIDYSKYFELNRADRLPEATLYSWDNATGDPEIFAGYLLNPKMPFSAWKGMEVGTKVIALFGITDYETRVKGYRDLNEYAVEHGATIPLLQSVQTLVRRKALSYEKFANGWVLANTMKWVSNSPD